MRFYIFRRLGFEQNEYLTKEGYFEKTFAVMDLKTFTLKQAQSKVKQLRKESSSLRNIYGYTEAKGH